MTESTNTCTSSSICFDAVIVEEHVRCSTTGNQEYLTIPIDDIVCVLPSDGGNKFKHTMLFIQGNDTSGTKDLGNSTRLERIHLKSAPSSLLSSHIYTETASHLRSSTNGGTRVHVIISTGSGMGMAKSIFSHILQPLLGYLRVAEYEVHETKSACTITELCHSLFIPQSEAGILQTIILLSGDGGLCDLINAFYNYPMTLHVPPNISLIPVGTGNAMASSIGLLAQPKAALMTLLRGSPVSLPVFAASFSSGASYVIDGCLDREPLIGESPLLEHHCPKTYGGVVASWGIHAALVADSDTVDYRKFGADRFKMAAKELLFPSDGSETHKYSGIITLIRSSHQEGREYEEIVGCREHMYVLATLVSNLEKDFMISPHSAPLDGRLRIIHFPPVSPERAMQILSAAYQKGQHVNDENVMYSEIEGFRIDFQEVDGRWRRVCIDGKVVVVEDGGWMEVRKERRRLLNIISSGPSPRV
ncbi:hypothetical protein ARAM_007513 [Aspergillus rambellii]|uniref:DAGKc domain-containing protein n=1 Tax=Aspergillus rambellii TaxID=308745 RepID=A0A0F8TZ28_9EURO|nr:hypothetical protein ARAM_007513 [Aspergillus rambellii]